MALNDEEGRVEPQTPTVWVVIVDWQGCSNIAVYDSEAKAEAAFTDQRGLPKGTTYANWCYAKDQYLGNAEGELPPWFHHKTVDSRIEECAVH